MHHVCVVQVIDMAASAFGLKYHLMQYQIIADVKGSVQEGTRGYDNYLFPNAVLGI